MDPKDPPADPNGLQRDPRTPSSGMGNNNDAANAEKLGTVTVVPPEIPYEPNFWTRNGLNLESFKRRSYGLGVVELERQMKARHCHMIAIGGSIGAGFFVGSGKALSQGGPGALLIDFLIIGVMIFNVVHALGELAVMFPVSGGFYLYSSRFISPAWGFAMGWNYTFQWFVVLPLEIVVSSFTVQYWNQEISHAVWISLFLGAIIIINIWGLMGYAEEEFWAGLLKLAATIVFMVICLVLVLGGGPKDGLYNEYWGARLWYEPGAFRNGFRGFCSVFVTAAFSFNGTELVGLAAAETRNPVKALPGAIKQVFWRITMFYILGLTFVGLLIDSTDKRLLGAGGLASDSNASPFVLVGKNAGLYGFDSFMNVIILISVLSIGVSAVYGGSRTLTALAQQGYAPRIFTYIDRSGRPLFSVLILLAFGSLAYLALATEGETVFNWLLAISGLACLFTWGSICLAHIRFRSAWKKQGHSLEEIPFRACGGVAGSWLGLILCGVVLVAQLFVSICPIKGGYSDAEGFFSSYLAFFVIMGFWAVGWLWKGNGWLRLDQIDVDSNRRDLPWEEIHAWRQQRAAMPAWKRIIWNFFV